MIPILFESNETEFTSNGLGRLRDCTHCEVTEERNGIYECEFEYPVNGSHYDDIQCGRIIGVTHDESGDIQPFDIYSFEREINGTVTFRARHISYRLSGEICLAAMGTNTLAGAFRELSNLVMSDNMFNYFTDFDILDQRYMAVFDSAPRTVKDILGGTEGSILDTYGGEYEWDKFNVTLWKSRGQDRDFTIRYGVNLTDYTESLDFSESYSWVWAYYKNGDDIAVSGYWDTIYRGLGNRRVGSVLDVTDKFETTPTLQQLKEAAMAYIEENQPWLPQQNITVDFVRFQDSPEFSQYKDLLKCNLCDTIRVIFPRYNMEGRFKIVKVVWDVLMERYSEMELGSPSTTLSEALGLK